MSDLLLLVKHFIEQKQQSVPEGMRLITDDAIEIMQAYSWPGNVRELANCVEHALVLCDELPIHPEHIPPRIQHAVKKMVQTSSQNACSGNGNLESAAYEKSVAPNQPRSLKQLEMQAIFDGLGRNSGNKSKTADELGISLKTLYNKLNQIENTGINPEAA